jgi:hypothetical protein
MRREMVRVSAGRREAHEIVRWCLDLCCDPCLWVNSVSASAQTPTGPVRMVIGFASHHREHKQFHRGLPHRVCSGVHLSDRQPRRTCLRPGPRCRAVSVRPEASGVAPAGGLTIMYRMRRPPAASEHNVGRSLSARDGKDGTRTVKPNLRRAFAINAQLPVGIGCPANGKSNNP